MERNSASKELKATGSRRLITPRACNIMERQLQQHVQMACLTWGSTPTRCVRVMERLPARILRPSMTIHMQ